MRAVHHVRWTIEDGEEPRARFTCFAAADAPCRTSCGGDCESCGPGEQPGTCEEGHQLVTGQECLAVDSIDCGDSAGEAYSGDEHELRSGAVDVIWDDYDQVWRWRYLR